ncbi:hypothetical protein FOA52_007481 [Chlamydomonas sp. UWO 241]|nr:hypothetical protein FOA52_007481 [Chlamydomonas sp. UWO 241]
MSAPNATSGGELPVGGAPEQPPPDFNDVFSLRAPKDAKAGLSSGAQSIAKGVVGGLVGLVAAPLVGAKNGGVIVRGVAATPGAITARKEGKEWNAETHEWEDPPGNALVTKSFADRGRKNVRDLVPLAPGDVDYYAILGVKPTDDEAKIKKQYYFEAKKCHPDKNPDDEEAKRKFQVLGEAYQVLGDPVKRAKYDQHGKDGVDKGDMMDGGEFFGMLFGNDKFEELVGELIIAAATRLGKSAETVKGQQKARVSKLVESLRKRLDTYMPQAEGLFLQSVTSQAKLLVCQSFGQTMLNAIGDVYAQQARIALGGFFGSMGTRLQATKDNMGNQMGLAKAAIALAKHQQMLAQLGTPSEGEDASVRAQRLALQDLGVAMMLDAMWAANLLDINTTLAEVCAKVLDGDGEKDVPKATLKLRAQALQKIGAVYQAAVAPDALAGIARKASGAEAARGQMQAAMLAAQDKAAGFGEDGGK